MGISYNTSIVRDGLVLHLDAANSKSYPGTGNTWYDLSGNDNNMTLSSVTHNSGVLSFNGSTSYGDLGANNTLSNTSATISCWAKVEDFTTLSGSHTQQARIFVTGNNRDYMNLIGFWNGGYGWENSVNSSPYEVNSTNVAPILASGIDPQTWFYFVLVFDNSTASSYVNGNFITSIADPNVLYYRYLGISSINTNYPDAFYGDISTFQVYNKPLSEDEIKQNFNALKTRYGL